MRGLGTARLSSLSCGKAFEIARAEDALIDFRARKPIGQEVARPRKSADGATRFLAASKTDGAKMLTIHCLGLA